MKVSIRPIEIKDADILREWKNNHRFAFFYKDIITSEQQFAWMDKYFSDKDNFMFMVEYDSEPVGCLGFKKMPDGADIYNVILGRKEFARKGVMSTALELMMSIINSENIKRAYLKVISSNTVAINWYKKNRFIVLNENEDYILLERKGEEL